MGSPSHPTADEGNNDSVDEVDDRKQPAHEKARKYTRAGEDNNNTGTKSPTIHTDSIHSVRKKAPPDRDTRDNRTKRRKTVKSNGPPSRPLSAYNFFFREERQRLTEEQKVTANTSETPATAYNDKNSSAYREMCKKIGQRWRELNAGEKEKYAKIAEDDMKRYRREKEKYNEDMIRSTAVGRASLEGRVFDTSWRIPAVPAESTDKAKEQDVRHSIPDLGHLSESGRPNESDNASRLSEYNVLSSPSTQLDSAVNPYTRFDTHIQNSLLEQNLNFQGHILHSHQSNQRDARLEMTGERFTQLYDRQAAAGQLTGNFFQLPGNTAHSSAELGNLSTSSVSAANESKISEAAYSSLRQGYASQVAQALESSQLQTLSNVLNTGRNLHPETSSTLSYDPLLTEVLQRGHPDRLLGLWLQQQQDRQQQQLLLQQLSQQQAARQQEINRSLVAGLSYPNLMMPSRRSSVEELLSGFNYSDIHASGLNVPGSSTYSQDSLIRNILQQRAHEQQLQLMQTPSVGPTQAEQLQALLLQMQQNSSSESGAPRGNTAAQPRNEEDDLRDSLYNSFRRRTGQ